MLCRKHRLQTTVYEYLAKCKSFALTNIPENFYKKTFIFMLIIISKYNYVSVKIYLTILKKNLKYQYV